MIFVDHELLPDFRNFQVSFQQNKIESGKN